MLKVLTCVFAVIGLLITLLVLVGIGGAFYYQDGGVKEPNSVVLSLDFDQPVIEQSEASPLDMVLEQSPVSLFDLIHAIDKARLDPHVKGIVAHFDDTQPSLTHSQEIRSALQKFRQSGKFTYAFGSSYGGFGQGNSSYYLASVFEDIWLQPVGSVSLAGVAIQSPFLKTAFDKAGIHGDFMQREEYKSIMEMFTRDEFSQPVKVEMQALVDNIGEQIASGIADGRHFNIEKVKSLMSSGPYTDEESLKIGLVTHLGYSDELKEEIKKKAGANSQQVGVDDYLSYKEQDDKQKSPPTHIAFIHGTGLIANKAGGSGGLSGEHSMGASEIAGAFDDAVEDKNIKAILFRIDSRGGSPDASETIRHALVHAKLKGMPVIVSMGDVAASGGYWIAMNANKIIADPATLTGSIGVVAGKFVVGELAQKLGVSFDTVRSNDSSGMWSPIDGFSPHQRERVNSMLDQTYHAFITNVSEARKIPIEKMADIAKGRVWTGDQAIKIGLVDELGGYDAALKEIRNTLKLSETDMVVLDEFPAPVSPAEKILKLFKGVGIESAMIGNILTRLQQMNAVLTHVLDYVSVFETPSTVSMPRPLIKVTQ